MVKYVEYNGTRVPYSIGYYALKRFKGETGTSFEDTPDEDLESLEVIAWYAIEAGAKIDKVSNPLKREDMEFFLNECMIEFTESIPDFFQVPPTTPKPPTGGTRKPRKKASSTSRKSTPKK